MESVLGLFGNRLLYRCTFNVDVSTTENKLDRLIEDALKDEAEPNERLKKAALEDKR